MAAQYTLSDPRQDDAARRHPKRPVWGTVFLALANFLSVLAAGSEARLAGVWPIPTTEAALAAVMVTNVLAAALAYPILLHRRQDLTTAASVAVAGICGAGALGSASATTLLMATIWLTLLFAALHLLAVPADASGWIRLTIILLTWGGGLASYLLAETGQAEEWSRVLHFLPLPGALAIARGSGWEAFSVPVAIVLAALARRKFCAVRHFLPA